MISKIVNQTAELDALTVERKVYHAPVARIVNIFGNRLMAGPNGEQNWGGQNTQPGVGSGPSSTTYTDGIPGTYGQSDDPDNFSKGYNTGKFFFGE
jgi:hypothetical protein